MKRQAVAVVMVLAGCSHSPLAPSGAEPLSSWYDAGVLDARHGRVVKDNDTLAEWYGNPQVDREDYLRGYLAGQKKFCQPERVRQAGLAGERFPASCDGVPRAVQLRDSWQSGADEWSHRSTLPVH